MPVSLFPGVTSSQTGTSVTDATYPLIVQQYLAKKAAAVFAKYPGACHMYLASNAYSDTAGTQLATTGQAVQRVNDSLTSAFAFQTTNPPSKAADGSILFNQQFLNISIPAWGVADSTVTIVGCTPLGTSANSMGVFTPAAQNAASTYARLGAVYFINGTTAAAEWCSDTPTDYATTAPITGTFAQGRVLTARRNGSTGQLRIGGVNVGTTVSLTGLTASTAAQGYIGAQYANDTSTFIGNLYIAIAVKGVVSDADLLTLEQYAASVTPTQFSL